MMEFSCENMKIMIMLLLLALFSETQGDTPPRSVNLAVETSFVLDPKLLHLNTSFIRHMRKFLEDLNKLLKPQPKRYLRADDRALQQEPKEVKQIEVRKFDFVDWIKNASNTIVNFTETNVKKAYNKVADEVSKATNATKEAAPKKNILDYVKFWRNTHPKELKRRLNSALSEKNTLLHNFARKMNNYYSEADVRKLYDLVSVFKRQLENDIDTSKVVKELLNTAVYKKYDSLDDESRAELKNDLLKLSEYVALNNNLNSLENNQDLSYNALRRSIDKKLKVAREAKKHKDGVTNELVVNNFEVFLQPTDA